MRSLMRMVTVGVFCLTAAGAAIMGVMWAVNAPESRKAEPRTPPLAREPATPTPAPADEAVEKPRPPGPFVDAEHFEDGGVVLANTFTGPVRDPKSLKELGEAIRVRGPLALDVMRSRLDLLHLDDQSSPDQVTQGIQIRNTIGLLLMYQGKFAEADAMFTMPAMGERAKLSASLRESMVALRGIVAMRRGELENCIECVGPSSCIFPISRQAVHANPKGSRQAIEQFTTYLDRVPGDLRVRWLLNLAYMTLGEYPAKVPARYLVPIQGFESSGKTGRFENVAGAAGLNARGPNLAGGSIFDDFTGDGLPDLFMTALDADRGAWLFVNKGDGTFEDRTDAAHLQDQIYALNVTRADIDNDGDLDVLLLRGAWEKPMRPSLLRNAGDGTFEDVTIAAGMGEPISSETAAWGDYDNDGRIDLYLGGEYLTPGGASDTSRHDPRNRCRLYHNEGNGTFVDRAAEAGVVNEQCTKGTAWGDYDDDGRLDLFVSNMNGPARLYHQEPDGKFRDVAPSLDVTGADLSFACWFWDYDNDGKLDIYVNEYMASLAETVAHAIGMPTERTSRPRLYRNLGVEGFRDVTAAVGLNRPMTPMGCNIADLDNDGYLDFYLGTGGMSFEFLVPNLMYRNVEGPGGRRFEDVTTASGTGHLQKGHGVSFADYDDDGDLDFFVEAGGAVPGDKSYNLLFKNPGNGRDSLKVRLVGTKTNRAAIGARIKAVVKGPDGASRTIHRTIGNNSSFGGNSLVELLGLGDAKAVAELEIRWPTSRTTQTFRDLAAGQTLVITEGNDRPEARKYRLPGQK